jgi:hypothetical protein
MKNKTAPTIDRDIVVTMITANLESHGIPYDTIRMGEATAVNARHGQHTQTWWVTPDGGSTIRFIDGKRLLPDSIEN